ncbi:hypothetical protein D3C72_2439060 [compost metagenome]
MKVFATARNEELLASLVNEIAESGGVTQATFAQDFVASDRLEKIICSGRYEAHRHSVNNAGGSRRWTLTPLKSSGSKA